VLGDPDLAPLFGPQSRAEVAIAARVRLRSGASIEVTGQIDRIGLTAEHVCIADFKAGTPAPETEPRHILQLALYRAAVAPLYPERGVRAFLVWTALPRVEEIGEARLAAALDALEPERARDN
jgi:ATP-dependent helicase/nuclease subunit A